MKRAPAFATLGLLCAATHAHAAGFGIYDQGAAAMGTAGAFTARANDPSSIYFNPAGLGHVEKGSLLLSPNLIHYKSEFSGVAPYPGYGVEEETKGQVFPPFSAYYAQRLGDPIVAGIGVYTPYGLQVEWKDPDTFTGRTISTLSRITPFFVAPTVAWAPSPKWRVGAGAVFVWSTVELHRHLQAYNPFDDRTDDIGRLELDSDTGTGMGFNAGVQFWPDDRMRFGATWRGKVDIDYDGNADFTQLPTGNPTFDGIVAASFPPDQRFTTAIAFPAQASLGIARRLNDAWSAEVDVNWTQWSSFDRLDLAFADTPSRNLSNEENWKDAWNVRTGLEYRAHDGTSPWAWRAGYYYDESPQPTEVVGPLLPDANRHALSAGAGWRDGSKAIDAFVLFIQANERSTEGINRDGYDGTYSSASIGGGVSLGVNFR